MHLVLREQVDESEPESAFNYYPPPSLNFCQIVVKLAARLMFSLKDKYSLKDLCGGTLEFGNADRTLRVLVHILLPLCIRLGTGSKGKYRKTHNLQQTCSRLVPMLFQERVIKICSHCLSSDC